MPTTEFTKTFTVDHKFEPGQVVTDGRYTYKVVSVDAEAEEYVVDDLDGDKGQGISIVYTDAKFGLKPKQAVFVCYSETSYEGCSAPISVHSTLQAAQEHFGPGRDWNGPSVDREWSSKGSFSDYDMICEMEVV